MFMEFGENWEIRRRKPPCICLSFGGVDCRSDPRRGPSRTYGADLGRSPPRNSSQIADVLQTRSEEIARATAVDSTACRSVHVPTPCQNPALTQLLPHVRFIPFHPLVPQSAGHGLSVAVVEQFWTGMILRRLLPESAPSSSPFPPAACRALKMMSDSFRLSWLASGRREWTRFGRHFPPGEACSAPETPGPVDGWTPFDWARLGQLAEVLKSALLNFRGT